MAKNNDNPYRTFIRFKLEKIVTALYLVSNLLSDQEPLRFSLRSSGLNLLECANLNTVLTKSFFMDIKRNLLYLRSQIGVARVAGIVSDMNASLIDKEIEGILESSPDFMSEEELSEDSFYVPKPIVVGISGKSLSEKALVGAVGVSGYSKKMDPRASRNTSVDNGERKAMILRFVRGKGEVSISDLRSEIKNFSEKTITRDLQALSDEGLVKKDGSRRWTRYKAA